MTFQDLLEVKTDKERMDFVLSAINAHKSSDEYKKAIDGYLYSTGKNATIMAFQKLLYKITGEAVPDNWSANHKCKSGFFKRFVIQSASYLLGNGATFTDNAKNKEKLGKDFDKQLYKAGKIALSQVTAFGFFNKDHLEVFSLRDFAPLYDEENGALMAGIRFWQIDNSKPLRATLYEIDGYTDFIKRKDEDIQILNSKRPYLLYAKVSNIDGTRIYGGANYPTFPIVPLWGNPEHQSELVGIREQIDCYDLIKSGFANDIDEASVLYWTITNSGGMSDEDLARFKHKMKTLGVANLPNTDDGSKAEAHTIDVPYEAREAMLDRLEKDLYKDYMALDVEHIASGATTATQIRASYEPLNEKIDEFEFCILEFLEGVFAVAGIEDTVTFTRSQIVNVQEDVETVLTASDFLDDEYITKKILTLMGDADEFEDLQKRKDAESYNRLEDTDLDTDVGGG